MTKLVLAQSRAHAVLFAARPARESDVHQRAKRLTLFVEAINVYKRSNVRQDVPSVDRRTFLAMHLFETMRPLVPSIGVLVEF